MKSTIEKREAQPRSAGGRPATTETPEGPVDAWVWVSRTSNGTGGADLDTIEARLRAAHGVVGTGVEYVRTLVHAMEPQGMHDPLVGALWTRLRG